MSKKIRFVATTAGLYASHANLKTNKLMRVDVYYNAENNTYLLKTINGHNLARICKIPTIILSNDQYSALVSDFDHYDDFGTFTIPLMRMCGIEI